MKQNPYKVANVDHLVKKSPTFHRNHTCLPYSLESASNVDWVSNVNSSTHFTYQPLRKIQKFLGPFLDALRFQHLVAQHISFALKRPQVQIPVTWLRLLMHYLQTSTEALQYVRYLRSIEHFIVWVPSGRKQFAYQHQFVSFTPGRSNVTPL
jgi:hypothetical protein